jgi:hypothetical protein
MTSSHRTPESRRERRRKTKLGLLLQEYGLRPIDLERKLRQRLGEEHAPDQKQVWRWCQGVTEPRRKWLVRILWAVRELANKPDIPVDRIIDLETGNPENWND